MARNRSDSSFGSYRLHLGGVKTAMKQAQSSLLKIVLYLIIIALIISIAAWVLFSVKGAGTPGYFQNILGGK